MHLPRVPMCVPLGSPSHVRCPLSRPLLLQSGLGIPTHESEYPWKKNQDSVTTARGIILGPPILLIPVNDPVRSMGWSQNMQTSRQPVWPSAGPILVQLVTNDSELAAKYLCSPVIDPEAGAYVKLLSDRCIRDFLVNDSTNQSSF